MVKPDNIETHNHAAEDSNWEFSTLIDRSVSPKAHSNKRILAELADFLQAPPKSAIKQRIGEMRRIKCKTASFACTRTGFASNAKLSSAVLAIETLFQ